MNTINESHQEKANANLVKHSWECLCKYGLRIAGGSMQNGVFFFTFFIYVILGV